MFLYATGKSTGRLVCLMVVTVFLNNGGTWRVTPRKGIRVGAGRFREVKLQDAKAARPVYPSAGECVFYA